MTASDLLTFILTPEFFAGAMTMGAMQRTIRAWYKRKVFKTESDDAATDSQ